MWRPSRGAPSSLLDMPFVEVSAVELSFVVHEVLLPGRTVLTLACVSSVQVRSVQLPSVDHAAPLHGRFWTRSLCS